MNASIKVAIQGDKASFHEIAAQKYYTQSIELIYCASFEEVFNQLVSQKVDNALVATSNTSHGDILEVKKLIDTHPVVVEGEYSLPIEQHLIGHPGTSHDSIQTITSHPVALSQCDRHIAKKYPSVSIIPYHDTSAAIEYVKKLRNPTVVAIGSEEAAKLHGLEILEESIQNDPHNATMFTCLSLKH